MLGGRYSTLHEDLRRADARESLIPQRHGKLQFRLENRRSGARALGLRAFLSPHAARQPDNQCLCLLALRDWSEQGGETSGVGPTTHDLERTGHEPCGIGDRQPGPLPANIDS